MTYSVNTPYNGTPGFVVTEYPNYLEVRQGSSTDHSAPVMNLPAYTAQVMNGTALVATYNVPRHDRFSRWVHEITPDQIIRDHKAIVAQGLFFPYGTPGAKQPPAPTNKYAGPSSPAGIDVNMGDTGQRPDIEVEPEWEAYALRTGDFGPCLEAAKGFDSMPIFIVDERTGRFWNMITKPQATIFWNQSGIPDYIAMAPQANADPKQYPPGTVLGQWAMNIPHHPAINIAYVATGNLRYLGSLQGVTNLGFLTTNWYTSITGKAVVNLAEERGAAWHFRSLLDCYIATVLAEKDYPTGLPAPLLPSSYWKQLIDNQLELFMLWVNDPANDLFRQFVDVTGFRPWQNDYMLEALCLAALRFPGTQWTEVFLWALKDAIDRLNNTSGWPPCHVGPYQMPTGPNMPSEGDNNWPNAYPATAFFKTRGEAWLSYAAAIKKNGGGYNMTPTQIDAIMADPLGGGDIISWDPFPALTLRNVMAAADHLDLNGYAPVRQRHPQFQVCLDRITSMVQRWEAKAQGNIIPSRVSIVSGPITAPPVQPPTTQPPTGEPPMSTPLEALDTIVATLKADVAAEIKAVHDRISAIVAAAQGGTVIDPAELQAQVDALNALHQTLTADTATLPAATS
jgi:hypothetical protein